MFNELNKYQENLIEVVFKEWVNNAHCGKTRINQKIASDSLKSIYKLADLKDPKVIFLKGPKEAYLFCKNELHINITTLDYFGCGYNSGWASFYDYFQRIGIIEKNDVEFNIIKDFLLSGVWATILFENLAICIARPNRVCVDEKGNLHSGNGPAISFDDGYEEFAWHGVWVTKQIIMNSETLTKEQIVNEKNSEISRAIAERLGWDKYLEKVDSVLVDKWFDETTLSHYELYDFKERKGVLQPRLLKMESPELNDGTHPYYIEPVPPQIKTCKAARRWQCDPSFPSIEECNTNSELIFEKEC